MIRRRSIESPDNISRLYPFLLALTWVVACQIGETALAAENEPRQRYTTFKAKQERGYSLAKYFFKPYEEYPNYKYHYVVAKDTDRNRYSAGALG